MDGKMEPELTVQCDTSIGLAAETLGSEESSFASNSGLDGDSGLENYEPESFLSSESKFSYLAKYISYSLVESSMICTAESWINNDLCFFQISQFDLQCQNPDNYLVNWLAKNII